MRLRRVELICGVLGGALGLAALAIGLFAPLGTSCASAGPTSPVDTCTNVSQVQIQGLASLWLAISLFGGLSLAVLIFSLWHSLAPNLAVLILQWISVGLLCAATLLALLSIGILFLPADALAVTAVILGTIASTQSTPATPAQA
jgi:hypothetical protein